MTDSHPNDRTHYEVHTPMPVGFTKRETFAAFTEAKNEFERQKALGRTPSLFRITIEDLS